MTFRKITSWYTAGTQQMLDPLWNVESWCHVVVGAGLAQRPGAGGGTPPFFSVTCYIIVESVSSVTNCCSYYLYAESSFIKFDSCPPTGCLICYFLSVYVPNWVWSVAHMFSVLKFERLSWVRSQNCSDNSVTVWGELLEIGQILAIAARALGLKYQICLMQEIRGWTP